MFTTIDEALKELMGRRRALFPQLYKFKKLMKDLGDPQNQLKVLHVGGTNGKGSTTAFLRSALMEAGYRVGSFTSPHLVSHNDRFRINETIMSDEKLLMYINRSYPYWDQYDITMFEIDVLIATWYFLDEKVDVALYEVGMGGLYDATNVVTPLASILTNVSLDHMEYLGDTVEAIAQEKAGIIKETGLVFTGATQESVLTIFKDWAKRPITKTLPYTILETSDLHQRIEIDGHTLLVGPLGGYQAKNAALAYTVLTGLNKEGVLSIPFSAIETGLAKASWPGRFECLSQDPLIILDGAHNQDGVHQLVLSIKDLPRPLVIVFSALRDKQTDLMVDDLMTVADKMIVTEFEFYRAQTAEKLAGDRDLAIEKDFKKALQLGLDKSKGGTLLVTGSLYFISEARAYLLKEKYGNY